MIKATRKIPNVGGEPNLPLKRLFFALSCPPEQRRVIAKWRSALELRSGRPVPAANFHLTLLFLGSVEVTELADIYAAVAKVRVPDKPLKVTLDRLDSWRKAGVLVLAPQQPGQELLRLVYALEQAMLPFGVEHRAKEYRPHLTLMRDCRMEVPESPTPPEFCLRADRFTLYESFKGRYFVLREWSLIS